MSVITSSLFIAELSPVHCCLVSLKVPGHPGVVVVSRVGRGLPLELVLALLQVLLPVRDQAQILEDAMAGIVQVLIYSET